MKNEMTLLKKQHMTVDEFDVLTRTQREQGSRPQWNRDDWYDYLSQPGRQLVELNALTEERFLSFGSFLRDFHLRAAGVSDLATVIRDQMVGDDESGGVTSLQLLVERMSIFLQDIQVASLRNEQALTSICATLENLQQPLQAFQRITKTLQVVGVTTRVECSGFADSRNNLAHLSDSIRRLGSLIAVNMNEINEQVSILHTLSKDALRNESTLNKGQSARAMVIVEQARGVLVQLVENKNKALVQSESLTQSSNSVSHNIAEIVSSIQFHDITRQQIEHVTETIDSFKDAISKSFEQGDHTNRHFLEDEIADGCRLQSDQLQNSNKELAAAVWRIIESLHSLAGSVTTLANDTRSLGGDTQRDGVTFLDAIVPAIESVASVLNENMTTAALSARAVKEVVSAAGTMVLLVDEIEKFGAEMKVIALNASIESVHVKAGGSSLGVIADSIQELAREALVQTEELASGLTAITESANALGGVTSEETADHDGKVESLVEDSDTMLVDLRQTNSTMLESFAKLDHMAESLALDISAAASSIQVHREANTIIAQGIESLKYINEQFSSSSHSGSSVEKSTLFKGIQNRYSMRSERDVHDKVVDEIGEQNFSQVETKTTVEEPEHGLGANVELF